jgi:23S rRNA (adenine1618-N6)-methyltransferase
MHPDNPFSSRYNYEELCRVNPRLKKKIVDPNHQPTIDYSDLESITELNRALIYRHTSIEQWSIHEGYLCPGVPGRADYLFEVRDLLSERGIEDPVLLDIGTGANLIYPLLAASLFDWRCIASEANGHALGCAGELLTNNPRLKSKITLRHQPNPSKIFSGILNSQDGVKVTICNPPFYRTEKDATIAASKKLKQNQKYRISLSKDSRAFQGTHQELVCPGGEVAFIKQMIGESMAMVNESILFTSLVARSSSLGNLETELKLAGAAYQVIPMQHGNKTRRFIAWWF